MPYAFDYDGVSAQLYLLSHLAVGSKAACERRNLVNDEEHYEDVQNYLWSMKVNVSESIVNLAIKTRLLLDIGGKDDEDFNWVQYSDKALLKYNVGRIITGTFPFNLREICNKIIHGVEMRLLWSTEYDEAGVFYWLGKCVLSGERNGNGWKMELSIADWCDAMAMFYELINENIDWHHIRKWDE
ncbi:MAG: hypothetical protein AB7U29_09830 [Desulfobulbus sp.]